MIPQTNWKPKKSQKSKDDVTVCDAVNDGVSVWWFVCCVRLGGWWWQTDKQMDIGDLRVTFATENIKSTWPNLVTYFSKHLRFITVLDRFVNTI